MPARLIIYYAFQATQPVVKKAVHRAEILLLTLSCTQMRFAAGAIILRPGIPHYAMDLISVPTPAALPALTKPARTTITTSLKRRKILEPPLLRAVLRILPGYR